jgi:hypothetical protein
MDNKVFERKKSKNYKFLKSATNCQFNGFVCDVNTTKTVELNITFWIDAEEENRKYIKDLFVKSKKLVYQTMDPIFYNKFISIQETPEYFTSQKVFNRFTFTLYPKARLNTKEIPVYLESIAQKLQEEIFEEAYTTKSRL